MQHSHPLPAKTEFCPYLGLQEDTQTCLAYAAEWNLCHRARPAAPVNLAHQRKMCLSPVHANCPVLQAEKSAPLPRALRAARSRSRWTWLWLAALLVLVALGLGFAWKDQQGGSWLLGSMVPLGQPVIEMAAPVASATQHKPSAFTPFPATFSPPAPKPSKTPTPTAGTHCGYALETRFLAEGRSLLLHRVRRGESINMLTDTYGTSLEALRAANYFLPSPLWSDLVIVIPVGQEDGEGLPVLEPVQVQEPGTTLPSLAERVSVTPEQLIEANALDADCQEIAGWVLVPRPAPKNR